MCVDTGAWIIHARMLPGAARGTVRHDEVFDYWFGASGAEPIEARIAALVNGTRYPYRRCTQRTGLKDQSCEISPAR